MFKPNSTPFEVDGAKIVLFQFEISLKKQLIKNDNGANFSIRPVKLK